MADSADERVHEDTKIMRQRLRERLDSAVENGDDVVTVSLAETRALLTGLGHAPLERAAIVRYLRGEGADLYAALIEDGAHRIDTAAVVRAYEEAVKSLAAEAVMIVEAQPDVYIDGLMGPHGAISLAMSALWQDPSSVHALAAYFGTLERTRQEYERPCAHLHGDEIECSWCGSLDAHIDGADDAR